FVWLAEETGLMTRIGDWVLEETCRQAAQWQESGPRCTPLRVCVNLSAGQHGDPGLVETVRRIVDAAGIESSSLCLGITQRVVMSDAASAIETLRALKRLGVILSIDDFASSESSLSAFKR